MGKAARMTEFGSIEKNNLKPELSTPSPMVYNPNKNVLLPKTTGAGANGLKW